MDVLDLLFALAFVSVALIASGAVLFAVRLVAVSRG